MSKGRVAKVGKVILVDEGEYSDYGVRGLFMVLKDFPPWRN
jgi:hypothetical protein